MTNKEAIEFAKEQLDIFGKDSTMYEFLEFSITALKLISTVDEAKELGSSYTSSYWQGWNDALEAIKVRLMNGDDWSDMNEQISKQE